LVADMKTLAISLCSVILALSFSSCGLLKGKYDKNHADTVSYIGDKKSSSAQINVEGLWYSPEWGIVVFDQQPNGKLTGIFRDYYTVNGVVSGKKIFIALVDDDWTEYTVELSRKNSETLTGYYSSYVPFSEEDKLPLTLKRISL